MGAGGVFKPLNEQHERLGPADIPNGIACIVTRPRPRPRHAVIAELRVMPTDQA
ncbi:hypothetical protein ACFXKS_00440 [Streptomyces scopuliridis]|uniref:hypothetical protein n=1 Tax=Streptomyces scopuliridis TaxID=452529 RepID=UPI0036AD78F5